MDVDDSLSKWNIPFRTFLASHNLPWDGVATGALVFDARNRVLLVQRTASDSMPHLWESPGGAVDAEDVSILAGCARELREETGLVAARVVRLVTEGNADEAQVFRNSTRTKLIGKYVFEVQAQDTETISLDEKEHSDFAWASKDEVEQEKMADGKAIPFTKRFMKSVVLEGFRLRQENSR